MSQQQVPGFHKQLENHSRPSMRFPQGYYKGLTALLCKGMATQHSQSQLPWQHWGSFWEVAPLSSMSRIHSSDAALQLGLKQGTRSDLFTSYRYWRPGEVPPYLLSRNGTVRFSSQVQKPCLEHWPASENLPPSFLVQLLQKWSPRLTTSFQTRSKYPLFLHSSSFMQAGGLSVGIGRSVQKTIPEHQLVSP